MTREKWKQRPYKSRYITYSLDGYSISYDSIERIDGVKINRNNDNNKSVISFKIHFKSGKDLEISRDSKRVFRNVIHKGLFGKRIQKKEVQNQWYFNNPKMVENLELMNALRKVLKESWSAHLRGKEWSI